jgi:diguanylate cyclase (GGDEF)-like protein
MQVASRLRACVRASDMVGRLDGGAFVVLLTDDLNPEQAAQVADKVIDSIRQPYPVPGAQAVLGASVCIALYPSQAATADHLLICADTAMYVAKCFGGGQHHRSD